MERIEKMRKDGSSISAIQRECGGDYFRIRRHLISRDLMVSGDAQKRESKKRNKDKGELIRNIQSMRADGIKHSQIAKELGISLTTSKRYGRV